MNNPIRDLATVIRGVSEASIALGNRDTRAQLLGGIAAALDAARAEIIAVAADETALYPEELEPEFDRMTGTLRMFAKLVRDGSWVRAAIDTPAAGSEKSIGPNHDIRKMLVPLGPVAVFGASNFPLAYGVCGGDTASALAAGCPVIVKEHPAHPNTGRLIYGIAAQAAAAITLPDALGYIEDPDPKNHAIARAIVSEPSIAAVGFTGSTRGGLALQQIASERSSPIPVYAEMGSCNAIVISPCAMGRRGLAIADEIADSLLARHGQQCTAPGIIFVQRGPEADAFFDRLGERLRSAPERQMLATWVADAYRNRLAEVRSSGRVHREMAQSVDSADPRAAPTVLFLADAIEVEDDGEFWQEIFGPAAIVLQSWNFGDSWSFISGSLVASIYCESDDDDVSAEEWCDQSTGLGWLRQIAGRLTFNSVPTGVRVCTSMVHGGPFPATNRPDTTAVGPLAIERWCRPVCFQNCPDALLPPELQDANPLGIWRTVNGQPTREPIRRGQ